MTASRAGLRLVYKKKLETVALVLLVIMVVFQHGFLELTRYNVGYHIYQQLKDEIGDLGVAVPEDSARDMVRLLEELGADRVEARVFYTVKLSVGDRTLLAPMIPLEELHGFAAIAQLKEGRPPEGPGEAAIYTVVASGARGMSLEWVKPGMAVRVDVYTLTGPTSMELTVTGVYKGFSWIAGYPYAVIVTELPGGVEGQGIAIVSARLGGMDPEGVAERLPTLAEEAGIPIYGVLVNTPERNPIVMLVKSAFNLLSIPASIMLAFAFILPAAVGTVSVFRDLRTLATLRAMGSGARELALYYTLPWIVRGLIGAGIAVILLALYSDNVYFRLFVGDSDIAQAMAEAYGFKLDPETLARAASIALALVLAGGLVPLVAASRVDTVQVLRSGGLPMAWIPPRIGVPGPLQLRGSLRDLAGRWWKLAGLALALAILWGVSTALEMETDSLDKVIGFFEDDYRVDVYAGFRSLIPQPPEPVALTVASLAEADERISGYTVFYSEATVTVLPGGGNVYMEYILILSGDPGIGFPLEEGRYPEAPGEAVISTYMAEYLGLGVGDVVELEVPRGGSVGLRIVGLTSSIWNNGFIAIVGGEGVFQGEPGLGEAVIEVDLIDGVEPEEFTRELRDGAGLPPYIITTQVLTRSDIVESLNTMMSMVRAFYSGIAVLTAVAAGIALAGVLLVDASARSKEYGALLAMGAGRLHILSGYLIQVLAALVVAAPLALALGYVTAEATARGTALALGYVPPELDPGALYSGLLAVSLGVSLVLALAAVLLHLRRLDLTGLLRE